MSIPPPESSLPPYDASPGISQDDKTMAMLANFLGIFTSFVGALVIYLVKKDQSKFVAYHSLQALIFQGALFVIHIVAGSLWIIGVGVFLSTALWVLSLVFSILGGVAANRGEWYEIPVAGKYARQQVGL